jgi:hypothetical protein
MKLLVLLAFLFIAELAHSAESDVLDLTDSDFDTTIKELPVALAMFYAPWCGKYKRHRLLSYRKKVTLKLIITSHSHSLLYFNSTPPIVLTLNRPLQKGKHDL